MAGLKPPIMHAKVFKRFNCGKNSIKRCELREFNNQFTGIVIEAV
jgi:predicted RNA-binding Zn-ribbon protein involved in translation (DUF1610 family)